MMSEIWNFSPTLKDQVQLCISAARHDEHNKWLQEFGHITRNQKEIFNREKVAVLLQPNKILIENDIIENKADIEVSTSNEGTELRVENIDEIVDSIETEFSVRVDFVIDECAKNSNLLHTLAIKLSTPTIEKLWKHICDKNDITKDFITKYFEYFLPTYIKRSYNSGTLDILVSSNKKFPLQFKLLLDKLIKDMQMSKQVLLDFVQLLDENGRSNFIMDLSEFDLSSQQFSHNILAIYNAYKDCKKSESIQNYLQSMLVQHSSACIADRHFGRLLLTYLQTQKSLNISITSNDIKNILESHRSPFKRPCLILLKELMGEDDQNKSASEDDSD